jgi:hypothetical protein
LELVETAQVKQKSTDREQSWQVEVLLVVDKYDPGEHGGKQFVPEFMST